MGCFEHTAKVAHLLNMPTGAAAQMHYIFQSAPLRRTAAAHHFRLLRIKMDLSPQASTRSRLTALAETQATLFMHYNNCMILADKQQACKTSADQ